MSGRVRYYEPNGTAVLAGDEELWRRLAASYENAEGYAKVSQATMFSIQQPFEKFSQEDAEMLMAQTFDALTSAKSELHMLHGLIQQLESQRSLSVTYIPDMRSIDDFHFQRNKQKLVKAEEKRIQMQEAAEILGDIHSTLTQRVKRDRIFYRELIGLSHFHSVRIQPSALSPFSVDLSLKPAWDVDWKFEQHHVDLFADSEGHISLDEDISEPNDDQVLDVLEVVETQRILIINDFKFLEGVWDEVLETYRKTLEQAASRKRAANQRPYVPRKTRASETTTVSIPESELMMKEEVSTERDSFVKRVRSLELDTEAVELLAYSEEEEEEGQSETSSEGLTPTVTMNEPLREEWFTKEELIPMTKVHMALCDLQTSDMWRQCLTALKKQEDNGRLYSAQHFQFRQILKDLQAALPSTLPLKTLLLMHFTDCLYRLPPFLHHIDIRDLDLTNEEKVLLLTSNPLADPEEAETGDKEIPTMKEEEKEWMTKLRPIQFFRYRFRDLAPLMETLLSTFLHTFHHNRVMTEIVWPSLKSLPGSVVHCERSPGRYSSLLSVQLPGSFCGRIRIEPDRIYLSGAFTKHSPPFRVPEFSIQPDQLMLVLKELID